MSGSANLKDEYTSVLDFILGITPDASPDELTTFILACAMRIWGSNELYAPEYAKALKMIAGNEYTPEQIMTAMNCCTEPERMLMTPAFFQRIVAEDAQNNTSESRAFIDMLGRFLAGIAFVNGDFTMGEANAVTQITQRLSDHATERGVAEATPGYRAMDYVTPLKTDSYWLRFESAGAQGKPDERAAGGEQRKSEPTHVTYNINLVDAKDGPKDTNETSDGHDDETPVAATTPDQPSGDKTLESLLSELDSLVGLDTVKKDVHSLINFIKVCRLRQKRGFQVPTISYHLVFVGNPGTGKTTVARLVAQLYYQMGLLPKGQLIETDRSGLVAGYLGQTAIKVQKVIKEAIGGVLFIDEAYSLANDPNDSYGKEAIETLLKAMEDNRDELVVIVAGYDALMHKFIDSNPGLRSRFNKYFLFPDYTGGELAQIFKRFCKTNGYRINDDMTTALVNRFGAMYEGRQEHFGNARTVRNLFEKAINHQANRIAQLENPSDDELVTLIAADIDEAFMGVG